ncbi:Disease resistance protein (CC-NBS-LRR class) family [Rhynchospora pubera]|uniref:Disease resistance protein (CC-NBS-LRR class) family n=1 Tax=Rhynchospora pubera TaxID=906938 RepID=A0AAV8GXP7_9POAL|nr:Disease resistance protein (CC-NBS-LRR class) family [Rhynchospora pubera]
MEDIAHDYLEELVQRCMVQVSKRSWSGRVKYCCVHDILHELAIHKAKENNFLLVCSEFNANSTNETSSRIRRITFHDCVGTELQEGSTSSNLRSLLFFAKDNYNKYEKVFLKTKLRMVRVLHSENDLVISDPKYLKHLTTLRYFRSYRYGWYKQPTSFWKNKMHLEYFKIEADGSPKYFVKGPLPSANLENLVTLNGVVARDKWKVKLPYFPNIRKLGVLITPEIDWEAITHSMSKLRHLHSLSVFTEWSAVLTHPCLTPAFKNFEQLHSLFLDCNWHGNVVGDSSLFPPSLVKLSLERSWLRQDPMPELAKLPNLRILHLLTDSYNGYWLTFSAGGFRCLQQLKLSGLIWLVGLEVKEGAMPMLNLLKIQRCSLKDIPNLQYLKNLRELKLSYMRHEFCSKLKGADQHKVADIPSVKVKNSYSISEGDYCV